jgi:hypothetical protein
MRALAARHPEYARLVRDGFFPLRVSVIENGAPRTLMEATSIERKSLDASLFEIPAGFTETRMPGMPRRP